MDTFAGSGSTGIAALLCEHPTSRMKKIADELNVQPVWGSRNAVLYEIGTYAAFAIKTITSRLSSQEFTIAAEDFLRKAQELDGEMYKAVDPDGNDGVIRYVIWSEVLLCPRCGQEISYFDHGTTRNPVSFKREMECPSCGNLFPVGKTTFATEWYYDRLLGKRISRKKRVPAWIYGTSNDHNWDRKATEADALLVSDIENNFDTDDSPKPINWGELHRTGYHYGITHLHHFYTARNYAVMSSLWKLAETYPEKISSALKLLLLSYNASHSTLMTRVVAKKNAKDFILTSAQSGVLYISRLPVEKNILLGLRRKAKSFSETYALLQNCQGHIELHNSSSLDVQESANSIDYVFTDPPFGDYIPYAEVNQINELWLGSVTNRQDEVIISPSQGKDVFTYRELLAQVFAQIARVLKPSGYASVVFHSAKAKVWEAFGEAIDEAGLRVVLSNILDKKQASFKQVVSPGAVQGDPLFLLQPSASPHDSSLISDKEILRSLMLTHVGDEGFNKRKLFSIYVNCCLEWGIEIKMDAPQVYDFYDTYNNENNNE